MGLFPRKYCNQTHIQSQLFQRQKMIFYNDKLIYTQNLKFYLKFFTELRNDFYSLRYLRLNHRSITVFLLNKPMGLFPSIYGMIFIFCSSYLKLKKLEYSAYRNCFSGNF
jgi:hypothetical protein